jgi:hypothetical protein
MKNFCRILSFGLLCVLGNVLLPGQALAQKSASDTMLSNGIRVGFDLGRVANYYLQNREDFSLEAFADVGYQRWLGVAEAGFANVQKSREGLYDYTSNGAYLRVGVERNLLKGGDDVVFWGLRYGVAAMGYRYDNYTAVDSVWGNSTGSIPQTAAVQHWGELVGGIKAMVLKNVYLGFTLRFRVKASGNYSTDTGPILIPGFGSSLRNTAFGANYYIAYRIPFKKPANFARKPKVRKTKREKG